MNTKKIIIVITIIAFLLRLIFLDTSYFFWDEAVYLLSAKALIGVSPYSELFMRPILLPLILSIFGAGEIVSRVVVSLTGSLFVPLAYFIGRKISKKTGIISSVFLAFSPAHIFFSRHIMADILAALLASAAIFFFWTGLENRSWNKTILGGVAIALSILAKFTSILALLIILPLLIIHKEEYKMIISSLSAGAIIILPYLIFNFLNFGNLLSPFINNFKSAAAAYEPASFTILLNGIMFLLGPVIIILLLYNLLKKRIDKDKLFLAYWLLISLIYYATITQRGVAKPPDMVYEIARFFLIGFIPAIILASNSLENINWKKIGVIFVVFMLVGTPTYIVAYKSSISHEEGLRETTKEIGIYLRKYAGSTVSCNFNCPPISYYSGLEVTKSENADYNLTITKRNVTMEAIKTIHHGQWTAILRKI